MTIGSRRRIVAVVLVVLVALAVAGWRLSPFGRDRLADFHNWDRISVTVECDAASVKARIRGELGSPAMSFVRIETDDGPALATPMPDVRMIPFPEDVVRGALSLDAWDATVTPGAPTYFNFASNGYVTYASDATSPVEYYELGDGMTNSLALDNGGDAYLTADLDFGPEYFVPTEAEQLGADHDYGMPTDAVPSSRAARTAP